MNIEDDLTPPDGLNLDDIPVQETPSKPKPPQAKNGPPAQADRLTSKAQVSPMPPKMQMRGVGEAAWSQEPVACVVEVLRRRPVGGGRWELVPPFTGTPEGAKWSFGIMTAAPTGTNKRNQPTREPHPAFAAFNTCSPELSCKVPVILVHSALASCWRYNLGMYATPEGKKLPRGWFCQGDGKRAMRWDGVDWKEITCPDVVCQYRQGERCQCTMNLTLIGQLNWSKDVLPKWTFQWSSKSVHNYANISGMFDQLLSTVSELMSRQMIQNVEPFPLFGFPFELTVAETVKPGKRFPEVHATPSVNLVEWIRAAASMMKAVPQLDGPKPLQELPAPGTTVEDMESSTEASLRPYRPANERGGQ